ncbi:hypothetical protein AYK26_06385 [Euryarchaeota archaeon SM23-78]|nr:MAG: hypothetical protein AYK26_06385 [Euryarchaeota archaeon SM23-78]MBW3001063.1 hypothetical protein [Candidatus Woesearchaeota archaeon]
MKHDLKIVLILILFFVLAQLVGLALINIDIQEVKVVEGVPVVVHEDTSLGPRPEVTEVGAFMYIAIGLLIGTILVLLIIRMRKVNLWKIWFFLAVFIAISLALGVIFSNYIALGLALALAILKVAKPNIFIHNITELLMYAGIAVFLVPLLNIMWAAILLIAISIYDFIAVFKSKHMVKMAKFQTKSKVFAGLFIPYTPKTQSIGSEARKIAEPSKSLKKMSRTIKKVQRKNAILGGGDIAFPLIFTGVVMESFVLQGFSKTFALYQSLIITLTTTIALALLFILAKKDKFYPAMPFISAGCFFGYALVVLLF